MEWKRGKYLGGGSFCDVNLVIPKGDFSLPQLMAVKSAEISKCCLLKKEKDILAHFIDCPEIVHCFGDDYTIENGHRIYNVFLEYAAGGSLWYHLKKSGGALMESDMKRYTRSILKGLCCIHEMGFVHCDIKLQNILVCSDSDGSNDVKIADFGLAKREGEVDLMNFRGTPLYMSPESIAYNVHEASGDVWSLGCVVAEMVMGRPAWKCTAKTDVSALLYRIGFGDELPEIPEEMSEQGKDFLRRCFVREPWNRWTAQMLLNHPFVAAKEEDDDDTVSLPVQAGKPFTSWSPRSAFDFPELRSSTQSSLFNSLSCSSSAPDGKSKFGQSSSSPVHRIREFVTEKVPNWGSSSDSWIIVREGQAKAESSSSPVFS